MNKKHTIKTLFGLEYETENLQYGLPQWYNKLLDKTLDELTALDLGKMVRQNVLKTVAVDKIVEMFISEGDSKLNMIAIEHTVGNFKYPNSFLKIIELNLLDFENWYILGKEQVLQRRSGLLERYPKRNLIPFARRDDNDDIACFEVGHGEKVFIVHDFASEGWKRRQEFDNFWAWFASAIKELIEGE